LHLCQACAHVLPKTKFYSLSDISAVFCKNAEKAKKILHIFNLETHALLYKIYAATV